MNLSKILAGGLLAFLLICFMLPFLVFVGFFFVSLPGVSLILFLLSSRRKNIQR